MINKHKIKIILFASMYFILRSSKYYFNENSFEFGNETLLELKLLSEI